ncbi:MAG TPA: 3-phosphoshikimate 1-carboxyvinyltransferase [Candidatus Dormibacteraeota bacterium]|nr:3-phosphoshikimate 1-carboxyvinyltransferase [Candidatus Dormibacteraeota bacterium]
MIATVRPSRRLEGEIRVPGDKSISHRAVILGSIASGRSSLRGLSPGADVQSTIGCLRELGADFDGSMLEGCGLRGLRRASGPLDCGNSGTTMRLLAGLLAAQEFESELIGDESLSRRPMDRVIAPLREMGARASWPPLRVGGETPLHGISYTMPVPSAQVKSAVLIAGLFAGGVTSVIEPVKSRDHTELMLRAMGATVAVDGLRVQVDPVSRLEPLDLEVPGDLSASAFWLVAAGLIQGSRVRLEGVGVNPTRTAFINLLLGSGFKVKFSNSRFVGGEPVADLEATSGAGLRSIQIGNDTAAEMIDELPVLAVAATQIPGRSVISGAAELRVKESNRIEAMEEGLAAMGADITAVEDGWVINGPRDLEGARVSAHGDHRVAMALAVAGLIALGKTEIDGAECVEISYPEFFDHLEYLC